MSLYQAFLEALVRIEILRERFVQIETDDIEKEKLVKIINYLFDEYSNRKEEIELLIHAYRSGGLHLFERTLCDLAEDDDDIKRILTHNRRNSLLN